MVRYFGRESWFINHLFLGFNSFGGIWKLAFRWLGISFANVADIGEQAL